MKTMRAAILHGKEDLRIEKVPIPEIGPGEVLARVKVATTDGTDHKVFKRGYHAEMFGKNKDGRPRDPPYEFGHEWSGVVEKVGPGVTLFKTGDEVVAVNSAPDGTCYHCKKGEYSACENKTWNNGAYAEYIKVPAQIVKWNMHKIPKGVSFEEAAILEPLACVVHGWQRTPAKKGETVVIIGTGPIGLKFIMLAKAAGVRIIAIGGGDRLDAAKKAGADIVIDHHSRDVVQQVLKETEGRGADLVIEAVGKQETWTQAINMVRKRGRVNLFGGPATGVVIPIDGRKVHYDEILLEGVFHHTPEAVKEALKLIEEKKIKAELLVSHKFQLEQVSELFKKLDSNRDIVKAAVYPGE